MPYKKYGLQVYESGINFVVDIPELSAQISYNGLSFSIRLPYKLFGNNTKGQCGESPQPLFLEGKKGGKHLLPSFGCSAPLWIVTVALCEKSSDVGLALDLPSGLTSGQSLDWGRRGAKGLT